MDRKEITVDIVLKEFCFEHLDLFAWREDDYKTYNINSEFIQAFVKAGDNGEIYTATCDGRILVIGGIIKTSEKTGYCFTMFSKYAGKYGTSAARTVRRMFERMREDMGLHRLTTYNRIGAEDHNRWCEWLGFEKEGVVRKFDDEGNDYIQYGLVT